MHTWQSELVVAPPLSGKASSSVRYLSCGKEAVAYRVCNEIKSSLSTVSSHEVRLITIWSFVCDVFPLHVLIVC